MASCKHCGCLIQDGFKLCTDCNDPVPQEHNSAAWYLLPIFLGIIGSAVMYLVLRNRNRPMVKKGAIIGGIFTAVNLAINYIGMSIIG